ncbi:hypothetical protein [Mesorhizobium salmacidum]|uniref:Uncharacterized protein n=1 Tax=Mesorhizobium salmacidum TaxID=3015171 RepID=A0ABU8KRW0_9HYPH
MESFQQFNNALNDNQGTLSLFLFVVTIFFGWITGIFSAIRGRPKLRIKTLPGPTFYSVGGTEAKHEGYDVHRSIFAIYLSIANVGKSPASIDNVEIGYHWPISFFRNPTLWFNNRFLRHWITYQTVSVSDFYHRIDDDNYKGYPFLTQRSVLTGETADTYLNVGQSTNGVVYFEQNDSFGACFPLAKNGYAKIKIRVVDSFGQRHSKVVSLQRVSLEEARKYNPKFGMTFSGMRSEGSLIDLPIDRNGNLLPPQPEENNNKKPK